MEGAAVLDLSLLEPHFRPDELIPTYKKQPIYRRRYEFSLLIGLLIGGIALGFRYLITEINQLVNFVFLLLVGIAFLLKLRSSSKVTSTEEGIRVPHTWLTQTLIPWKSIISIRQENLLDIESKENHLAIRVEIDTEKLRYNTTGLVDSNFILTEAEFDRHDLERFFNEISKKKDELSGTPNTQAQRLTDQIERSWYGRWKLIFLNLFDTASEIVFFIILVDLIFRGLFDITLWPIFGIIIIALFFIPLVIYHILSRPTAIIGIRPHELGPLIYNEEEVITSVRFILMCMPFDVKMLGCELIFPENHVLTQVQTLKHIYPEIINKGELTYVVVQFLGNQTKAKGTNVKFEYVKDKQDSGSFVIPIYWA